MGSGMGELPVSIFQHSSVVEQAAVNRWVVGSSPTVGAIMGDRQRGRLETGQGVKSWGKDTCGENRMKMNVIDESQTSSEQTQVV